MEALHGARCPRKPARLPRPLHQVQVDHLCRRYLTRLVADAVHHVARVPRAERIAQRPAPAVHAHAHPPLASIRQRAEALALIAEIRLDHLERQRCPAATHRLRHDPQEHLTRFGNAADRQPQHLGERQPARRMARISPAPSLPRPFDLAVQPFIQPPTTAHHRHPALQPDPAADHIGADRADRLPGVGVVTHQLPRAVPQPHQAAIDLGIRRRRGGHPVRREARHHRTLERTPAAAGAGWHSSGRRLGVLPLRHQVNLTNRLPGAPSPAATFSAAFSRATIAFSCASRCISAPRSW